MHSLSLLASSTFGKVLLAAVAAAGLAPPQTAPAGAAVTSSFAVKVPQNDAELSIAGRDVPGSGAVRTMTTSPLTRGRSYTYTVSVTWKPNSYTTITRAKDVAFRAGDAVAVDLTVDDPADRVRVIYVPTPLDVAQAMVALAGVTKGDVVYEPGCGDARVTIAAIAKGAKRGICVDIDLERVVESRANVKLAGLQDRIEVRHGDALDVEDLSEVTVVFLYMGDHFDLLIRPVLWRMLPVGARIVSHRFTMGDWKPDHTEHISGADGSDYQIHLWTVTSEVKRRLTGASPKPRPGNR